MKFPPGFVFVERASRRLAATRIAAVQSFFSELKEAVAAGRKLPPSAPAARQLRFSITTRLAMSGGTGDGFEERCCPQPAFYPP
jgi:hypothetical protein